ncbi:MAG TPA: hypothetical protein VF958_00025, partial [Thermoanaerobaculia bacterium]
MAWFEHPSKFPEDGVNLFESEVLHDTKIPDTRHRVVRQRKAADVRLELTAVEREPSSGLQGFEREIGCDQSPTVPEDARRGLTRPAPALHERSLPWEESVRITLYRATEDPPSDKGRELFESRAR